MHLGTLRYHRPADLAEATKLAQELGPQARFLAGGTDLLVDLKQRRIAADHLISLADIKELCGIAVADGQLRLGASTTLSQIGASEEVRLHAPALTDTVRTMAAVQIRNRATLGGNFCAAVPCADTPPICIVSGATLRLWGPAGEREVLADSFFVAPRQTILQPGELLVEVCLPLAAPGRGAGYHRFSRRRYTSLAVAGVAAWIELDGETITDARLAMSSVAPTPLPAPKAAALLHGARPDDALMAQVGLQAAEEAQPITDLRGTVTFRRQLVEALTRRALADALQRARAH